MKKAMCLWSILIALLWPNAIFAEETVRITIGEWPPYMSKELKHYGFLSHIVSEAFALEGIKVKWGFFPWKRAFQNVVYGKWDATAGWSYGPDREKDFYFSDSIGETLVVFFHLKSYPFDWKTYEDLKGIEIGTTLEYEYGQTFEKLSKNGVLQVFYVPKDEQNFRKLRAGRIHIFPNNIEVGYEMINNLFPPDQALRFTHHPKPLIYETLKLLFSKKIERNKKLVDIFNRGLMRLRDSGRAKQIVEASRRGEYK